MFTALESLRCSNEHVRSSASKSSIVPSINAAWEMNRGLF